MTEQLRNKDDAVGIIKDKIKWLCNVDATTNKFIHPEAKKEIKRCADIIKENLEIILEEE